MACCAPALTREECKGTRSAGDLLTGLCHRRNHTVELVRNEQLPGRKGRPAIEEHSRKLSETVPERFHGFVEELTR